MFRHLMKLTWKRKSRNLMLSLEILLAFAIVFAIAAFAVRNIQLYQLPIGFTYDNMWSVTVRTGENGLKASPQVYDSFTRSLRELPEVEQVGFATHSPFVMSTMRIRFKSPASGTRVLSDALEVSDDFAAVAGITLAEGRWFSSVDDGAAALPVVINRAMARTLFPNASPLGKQFSESHEGGDDKDVMRVVGVIDDYRSKGELMAPVNLVFMRFLPKTASGGMRTMLVKVKPGTERAFETTLHRQLTLVRNDWDYEISPVHLLRKSILKEQMIPLIVLSVIAAFMLAMVAFGLFGVLWQSTTQRIPEIGLRRALGASAASIYRQIIAEQMLLSSTAMLVALILLVQLPLTGALGASLNWKVFLSATAVSMFVIYLISLLCALYPGWRASRLSPTEALHYE
jgi:putative ABC transport system permease protein